MEIPVIYAEEHEWIRHVGESLVRIGITDYAQDQLGDVVYVELLSSGKRWPGTTCWSKWRAPNRWGRSTPFPGKITDVNEKISQSPEAGQPEPTRTAGWC